MTQLDTDVLVVGAGLTGMLAAAELRRHRVSCRIIDRAPGRPAHRKALGMHPRTLEIMDVIGAADEFLHRGYHANGLELHLGRRSLIVQAPRPEARFPSSVIVPPGESEAILEARLGALGGSIERGTELLGVRQEARWVEAEVRAAGGSGRRIRSSFLIAADGADSSVRDAVGLSFRGAGRDQATGQGMTVVHAHVRLRAAPHPCRVQAFSARRGLGLIVPLHLDHADVAMIDLAKQQRPPTARVDLADLRDSLRAIAPGHPGLAEATRITTIRPSCRQASNYRAGRVFLAGDAAHIANPASCLSSDLGLQDAFSLAWRLALFLRGFAPQSLLDTYDAERRRAAGRAIRATAPLMRMRAERSPELRLPGRPHLRLLPARHRAALALSGLAIGHEHRSRQWAALRDGDQMPNLELLGPDGLPVRLYELLRHPTYALLIYASTRRLRQQPAEIAAAFRSGAVTHPHIRCYLLLSERAPQPLDSDAPVLIDINGQLQREARVRHGTALLVRPDGCLAFHGRITTAPI